MLDVAEPMTDEGFVAALRGLAPRYWDSHPFHLRLHDGRLTRDELRLWAANRWYYQRCLPQKDAAILANCPVPEVRRHWLERIVYHDGRAEGEGGQENWLRVAEALGLRRQEVLDQRHVLPGIRDAIEYRALGGGRCPPCRRTRRPCRGWGRECAAGTTASGAPTSCC